MELNEILKTNYPNYNFFGQFLYGSQNYKMDTASSDKDYCCLIVPTLYELATNSEGAGRKSTFKADEDGLQLIWDIRKFKDGLKSGSITAFELLLSSSHYFSHIVTSNNGLKYPWDNIDEIAYHDVYRTVGALGGIAASYFSDVTKFKPENKEYGYSPKALAHLYRIRCALEKYLAEKPYNEVIVPTDIDFAMDLRENPLPYDEAMDLAKKWRAEVTEIKTDFLFNHNRDANQEVKKNLDNWVYRVIKFFNQGEDELV